MRQEKLKSRSSATNGASFPTSIRTHHQKTLYRDFATGVGLAPFACCFEIFVACPLALEAAT